MPVLTFPCVVTHPDDAPQDPRSRTWIKGHDLASLALAATEQLALPTEQCEYMLYIPKVPHPAGVFLEVVHAGHSALVGPMAGPTPPADLLPERGYPLPELLGHVGLGPDSDRLHTYPVVVTYSGVFRDQGLPPSRNPIESNRQYRERCAAAESIRLERACHEGIHVAYYPVPSVRWTALDLERLLGIAYRFLPTREPQWRESGAILQEPFGACDGTRMPLIRYCLHIARGDYAAYLRLPSFPVRALTEWLETRTCQILLEHPIAKITGAGVPKEGPRR